MNKSFPAVLERLQLSGPQARMLRLLHAHARTPNELAQLCDTTSRARGFEENVRRLRSLGYLMNAGGRYVLADFLQRLPGGAR